MGTEETDKENVDEPTKEDGEQGNEYIQDDSKAGGSERAYKANRNTNGDIDKEKPEPKIFRHKSGIRMPRTQHWQHPNQFDTTI